MNDTKEEQGSNDADVQMKDASADTSIDQRNNDTGNASGTDDAATVNESTVPKNKENQELAESVVSMDSAAVVEAPTSRVPLIWSSFFRQLQRIEKLETRVEEHVSRSRRRIMNLLEQTPSHRRTHLRMFVSHFFDKFKGIWTLSIEGKLLIGNLDHANANIVDKEGVLSTREMEEEGKKR